MYFSPSGGRKRVRVIDQEGSCWERFRRSVVALFGAPNRGVHRYRLFGLAAVDLLATMLGAAVLTEGLIAAGWTGGLDRWSMHLLSFAGLVALGIVAHLVFRVDTALNRRIFGTV